MATTGDNALIGIARAKLARAIGLEGCGIIQDLDGHKIWATEFSPTGIEVDILGAALSLFELARKLGIEGDRSRIEFSATKMTVFLQSEGGRLVAVMIPTSSEAVKSIRRSISRAFKSKSEPQS